MLALRGFGQQHLGKIAAGQIREMHAGAQILQLVDQDLREAALGLESATKICGMCARRLTARFHSLLCASS